MTLRMSIKPGEDALLCVIQFIRCRQADVSGDLLSRVQYFASRRERRRVPPAGFMGNAAELTHHCPRGV